jgi:hypothetical protein
MGAAGLEPANSEEDGFTVPFPSTYQRKLKQIGAIQSMVYEISDCPGLRYLMPAFCSLVRNICVKIKDVQTRSCGEKSELI